MEGHGMFLFRGNVYTLSLYKKIIYKNVDAEICELLEHLETFEKNVILCVENMKITQYNYLNNNLHLARKYAGIYILAFEKRTAFQERSSRKTVCSSKVKIAFFVFSWTVSTLIWMISSLVTNGNRDAIFPELLREGGE